MNMNKVFAGILIVGGGLILRDVLGSLEFLGLLAVIAGSHVYFKDE